MEDSIKPKTIFMIILISLATMVIAPISCMSVATVAAGNKGVVTSFGKVNEVALDEGIHLIWFYKNVTNISCKSQNLKITATSNQAHSAVSKDLQTIGFTVDIAYYLAPADVWKIVKYIGDRRVDWEKTVIEPAMFQGVKNTLSKYSLSDIIDKREEIRVLISEQIKAIVKERLEKRDKNLAQSLQITQVTLSNIDYSRGYANEITKKQIAEQQVLRAKNELEKYKIDQLQIVVEAEMGAKAKILKARGEALAYLTKLGAEIQVYINLKAIGFEPSTYNFLAKWNGTLPTVLASNNALKGFIVPANAKKLTEKDLKLIINNIEEEKKKLMKDIKDNANK